MAERQSCRVAHSSSESAEGVFESLDSRSPDVLYLRLRYLRRHHIELKLKTNIIEPFQAISPQVLSGCQRKWQLPLLGCVGRLPNLAQIVTTSRS